MVKDFSKGVDGRYVFMSKSINTESVPLATRSTRDDRLQVKDVVGHVVKFYACVMHFTVVLSPINP